MEEPDKRRRHKREEMVKAIECLLHKESNQPLEFDGVIANISQSGLCLLTTEVLRNGQEITIKKDIFPYPRFAAVRWGREYNGLYYSYGLEFVEQQKISTQ